MPLHKLDGVRRAISTTLLTGGLLLLSVCGDPVSPGGAGHGPQARIGFAPQFQPGAAAALAASSITIDNVHIVIRRADESVVLDTVVTFPAGADSVTLNAVVPLAGLSEDFTALIQLRNGSTVLFEGTQHLEAHAGVASAPTVTVPVDYVGPGAGAVRVTIAPHALTLLTGGSAQLDATVFDANGAEMSGVPLVWSSSDGTIATVSPAGLVTALSRRGSAGITVSLLTGLSDGISASVVLPPSSIRVVSGSGQTGRAGEALAQPFVVEVDAADGVASPGVTVSFRAAGSGAATPASAVTGADGRASATLTLGGLLGSQAFEANALTFAPVTVSETATPGPAAQIAVVSGSAQSDTAGRTLAQPFVVRVTDAFGNAVSGASVSWQRTQGSGAVGGATSATGANGQASMSYTLGAQAGVETIAASIAGGASVSFSAAAIARAAAKIAATSGTPQQGAAGTAAQALTVLVSDALGNPVANVAVTWAVVGGATIASGASTTNAAGVASMNAGFGTLAGASTVFASFVAGVSAQFALTTLPGPASQIAIVAGDAQTAAAATAVPIAPAVRVRDSFGNGVAATVTFTVVIGGGSVTGSPATTDATGLATLGAWTLGPAGAQSMTASSGALSVTFTATSTGAGPQLAVTTQPSTPQINAQPFIVNPQVQLKNAAGANIATAGVPVTVSLVSAGQALGGTLTVTTDAAGLAVFAGLTITGLVGTNNMQFTAPGFASATSTAIVVTPGIPAQMTAVTATTFAGTAGALASPTPQVRLTDVSTNPVPGQTVTFAVAAPINGVVAGPAAVTNASGIASPTSWTLGATVRPDSMTATFAGVTGNPVTFVANASAGAATQIVIISGDAQTGSTGLPLALPLVAEARDALSNPVAGVNITFTVTAGGGTPATQTIATDGAGRSSFTWTMGPVGAQNVQACLPACSAPIVFNATSIPVGASAIWTGITNSNWSVAANWSPAAVPTAASNVFVPAGTANSPSLTAPVTVADLILQTGSTLNLNAFGMSASGDVFAIGAPITGGTVTMTGTGKSVGGTIQALDVQAAIIASGSATLTGLSFGCATALTIGTATVTVGSAVAIACGSAIGLNAAGTLTINGDFSYSGGASFSMSDPGAHLTVNGNVFGDQINMGDAALTAGLLEIKGNLSTGGTGSQIFRATGAHITRFSGITPQSVSMTGPGLAGARFQNLEFTGGVTVALASDIVAAGTVLVSGGTALTGGCCTLLAGGLVTTTAGTSMAGINHVDVFGGGAVFPQMAGAGPPFVILSAGTVTTPSTPVTLPSTLQISGGGTLLDVGAATITITGDLNYISGGAPRMNSGAGHLTVNGNVFGDQVNMNDVTLTAGLFEIKGNLTSGGTGSSIYRGVGTHTTRFSGAGPQSIALTNVGVGGARFQNVEFVGGNVVSLQTTAAANGTTLLSGGTTLTSPGGCCYLTVAGLVTSTAGTSMAGIQRLELYGTGAILPQLAGVGPPHIDIASSGVVTAAISPLTVPSSVQILFGGTILDVGASTITITGDLLYANGGLPRMTSGAGHLTVNGNVVGDQIDMGDVTLTAGLLEIKGDLSTGGTGTQIFRGVGTHITRFSGAGSQNVSFSTAGVNGTRFQNVEFVGGNAVTLLTNTFAQGTVLLSNNTALDAPGTTLSVAGLTTSLAGTSMASVNRLEVVGSGAVLPQLAGVGPLRIDLTSGGTVTAGSSPLTLPTNLLMIDAATHLDVAATTMTVTGDVHYVNGGAPQMTNAAGHLTIVGNLFGDQVNMGDVTLTAGLLELKGDLSTGGTGSQIFRAVGTHLTRISGTTGPQSLGYSGGGTNGSRFQDIEFTGGNTVTFSGNLYMQGTTLVTNNTTLTSASNCCILFTTGLVTSTAGTSMAGLNRIELFGGSGPILPELAGTGPPAVFLNSGTAITARITPLTIPAAMGIFSSGTLLDVGASDITIANDLSYQAGGAFTMTNPAGHLTVQGNVTGDQIDFGDTMLTDGLLEVTGNLSTGGTGSQIFRATGNHLTRFNGAGQQVISTTNGGVNGSRFQNVEVTNGSALGVIVGNGTYVAGNLAQLGRLGVTSSITIAGTLSLSATSITTVTGSLTHGICTAAGGAVFSGFICP